MPSTRAVLLLAALLALWNVWGYDLWAPDEPYFAEGAREMLVDGRWAVPHVNGEITADKPPLFFWLIAIASLPLGRVGELSARLPSALAALGSVALTLRLGRRLAPATMDPAARERLAALSGLILASTYLFWDKSRSAQIDSLLCFLVLTSLSAFESFRAGEARGGRAGLLFWSAVALAVVAKGPVGMLLPLGVALLTLLADGSCAPWKRFAPWTGPLLFSLLVGAWMAVATLGGGGEYSVWQAFRAHVIERAARGMHHVQPVWYYLKVLPVQLLPWSVLAPGAILLAWRGRRGAAERFLLVWILFVVGFFSIWAEKRDLYVLPAYPAFALLFARLIQQTGGREPAAAASHPRWVNLPLAMVGVLLGVAGAATLRLVARAQAAERPAAITLAFVLGAAAAAVIFFAARAGPLKATLATAGAAAALYLTLATVVFPALNPRRSARAFAGQIRNATESWRGDGGEILSLGLGNLTDAVAFYSGGVYVRRTSDPSEVAEHLDSPRGAFALVDGTRFESLAPAASRRWTIAASAELSGKRLLLVQGRR
jgi:4-amino-4-deoxy-L-arabinose transferase-like glycosyltransferase